MITTESTNYFSTKRSRTTNLPHGSAIATKEVNNYPHICSEKKKKKNRRVRETQKIKKNNTNKEFSTHFLSSLRFKCLHSHNSVVE